MSSRLRKGSDLRAIIEHLARTHDLPAELVKAMLADALAQILLKAKESGRLQLRGFGVFRRKDFAAKVARNPRTGETVMVPARSRLVFVEEATAAKTDLVKPFVSQPHVSENVTSPPCFCGSEGGTSEISVRPVVAADTAP